jgi:tRNA-5-taurinomethyluridine 2-sulfurtransferase
MKIAVLVSGGVDSSVALCLLKAQGHTVTAFYLKIWLEDELSFLGTCPWEEDLQYVEALCQQLDVPLRIISLQKEYWDEVVSYTIAEARAGRTPNPDVLCNQRVKFGAFFTHIGTDFDKVATGHYAQIEAVNGLFYLKQSPDPIKDQTYFLSHLTQAQLSKALFSIGHLEKHQVRELAEQYDVPSKARKDSQGICFLGKVSFNEFLRHYLGDKIGDLVEFETGKPMGEHRGFWYYTIGQRQGIGLAGGPWYVVAKNTAHNIVYISRSYYALEKHRNRFTVVNCNWFGSQPLSGTYRLKLRHGAAFHTAYATFSNDTAEVLLQERDQGIAPGQFAVFYEKGLCLGGGSIQELS